MKLIIVGVGDKSSTPWMPVISEFRYTAPHLLGGRRFKFWKCYCHDLAMSICTDCFWTVIADASRLPIVYRKCLHDIGLIYRLPFENQTEVTLTFLGASKRKLRAHGWFLAFYCDVRFWFEKACTRQFRFIRPSDAVRGVYFARKMYYQLWAAGSGQIARIWTGERWKGWGEGNLGLFVSDSLSLLVGG